MDRVNPFESMASGLVLLALPFVLPLFFCRNIPRKLLFYFLGLACCYLCYRAATLLWGFLASILGMLIASWRHEDIQKSFEYSYALILPGLHQGHPHMMLGLLPMLTLGTLLSIVALKILRRALLKPPASSVE